MYVAFVEILSPGRLLVSPGDKARKVRRAISSASVVQFDEPLPSALRDVLIAELDEREDLELYVYGHCDLDLDTDLSFLEGFDGARRLSLNLNRLTGLDGLSRFRRVRELKLQGAVKRLSLAPLARPELVERLSIDGTVKDLDAIGEMVELRSLYASASKQALTAIAGLGHLRRVALNHGTCRDLSSLATLPELADLEIWQIRGLTEDDLGFLEGTGLLSLALGGLRNVTNLGFIQPLAGTLRPLSLEKLPALTSYAPLSQCLELTAFGAWDARPADRDLRPLHGAPLVDITIGDSYPQPAREALLQALPAGCHTWIRGEAAQESQFRWRGLFKYADRVVDR